MERRRRFRERKDSHLYTRLTVTEKVTYINPYYLAAVVHTSLPKHVFSLSRPLQIAHAVIGSGSWDVIVG
jgi:hypothetical protein